MPFRKKNHFHIVTLGCAKNSVDSNSMGQLLNNAGLQQTDEVEKAEIIIVNTCGFIAAAREESYQVLGDLAAQKRSDQMLIAAGCLTQRYGLEVAKKVQGVDGILGTQRWMDIVEVVQAIRNNQAPQPSYHIPQASSPSMERTGILRSTVHGQSAYLKIAEGCRRPCAFCAIPLIKGTLVSRPIQNVIEDGRRLQDAGIQELILVAQDTTDYGSDLGMKDGLTFLVKQLLNEAPDIPWIRILYAFPGSLSDELIELMAQEKRILHYIDLPLQHAHPAVLRRMKRPANMDWVRQAVQKIRLAMPDVSLRTTFLVGYPGETEAEFEELLNFMREVRFDKVGAFQFSFEIGTPSEPLGDDIPPELKQERWDRLMAEQQPISLEKNLSVVGRQLEVLIEGQGQIEGSREHILIGRSYRDAPDVDGLVFVEGADPKANGFLPVMIHGAMAYDLSGTSLAPRSPRKPMSRKKRL